MANNRKIVVLNYFFNYLYYVIICMKEGCYMKKCKIIMNPQSGKNKKTDYKAPFD